MREFHLNLPTAFYDFLAVHSIHGSLCRFLIVISNEPILVLHLNMHYVSKGLKSIREIGLANATVKRSNIDLAFHLVLSVSEVTVVLPISLRTVTTSAFVFFRMSPRSRFPVTRLILGGIYIICQAFISLRSFLGVLGLEFIFLGLISLIPLGNFRVASVRSLVLTFIESFHV